MASFWRFVLALAEDNDSKPRDILDLSLSARETFPEKVLSKKEVNKLWEHIFQKKVV